MALVDSIPMSQPSPNPDGISAFPWGRSERAPPPGQQQGPDAGTRPAEPAVGPWGSYDAAPPPAPLAPVTAVQPIRLSWEKPHGLLGLSVANFLLKIPTLTAYGFWGKTEVRRRVWYAIRVDGEPLEYTGTGRELLVSFITVFLIVLLPALLVSGAVVLMLGPEASGAVQGILYVAFTLLYGIGAYRAQRYRLSRTRWRGIRMYMTGSSWTYGWTYFWTLALLPLTLGWIAPWRTTRLQAMMTRATHLGDRPLGFTASSGPLYGRFIVLWIGCALIALAAIAIVGSTIADISRSGNLARLSQAQQTRFVGVLLVTGLVGYVLYGIVSAWYRARVINHFAAHTHLEGARFKGRATAAGLIWLAVSNAAIVVLSLGVLGPLAQARSTRYLVEHLSLEGDVALAAIRQAPADALPRGEGLAQAFDFDAF